MEVERALGRITHDSPIWRPSSEYSSPARRRLNPDSSLKLLITPICRERLDGNFYGEDVSSAFALTEYFGQCVVEAPGVGNANPGGTGVSAVNFGAAIECREAG